LEKTIVGKANEKGKGYLSMLEKKKREVMGKRKALFIKKERPRRDQEQILSKF